MKNKIINFMVIALVSIFSLTIGATAAVTIAANQVTYNNTTVQAKVDELVDIVNNKLPVDPDVIDLDTFQTNTAKTIYASKKGVCIKRNGKLNCFKSSTEEEFHMREVFSDVECTGSSSSAFLAFQCKASDFTCKMNTYSIECNDVANDSGCIVSGSIVSCG